MSMEKIDHAWLDDVVPRSAPVRNRFRPFRGCRNAVHRRLKLKATQHGRVNDQPMLRDVKPPLVFVGRQTIAVRKNTSTAPMLMDATAMRFA